MRTSIDCTTVVNRTDSNNYKCFVDNFKIKIHVNDAYEFEKKLKELKLKVSFIEIKKNNIYYDISGADSYKITELILLHAKTI